MAIPARKIDVLSIVDAVDGVMEPPALDPVTRKHRRAVDAVNELGGKNCERFRRDLARINIAKLDEVGRQPNPRKTAKRA